MMKRNRKAVKAIILLVFCLIIHVYSIDPDRVENSYSTGVFVHISRFLRLVFGNLPFSIGDLMYGILVAWLAWQVGKFFIGLVKNRTGQSARQRLADTGYRLFVFCSVMYIVFNLLWGINYNRKGIASQLDMQVKKYTVTDLIEINDLLVNKVNNSRAALTNSQMAYPGNRQLYAIAAGAYHDLSSRYAFLEYKPVSLKTSMWGWLGNYTGFTGYYNPFTGEAQVNTTIPEFLQPFIACHEIAHQIGYAKEREASFVGYLVASNSENPLLQYSVYLELFIYANRNLGQADSVIAKRYRKMITADVLKDLKRWSEFNRRHRSIAEPLISWVYDKYLLGNSQPGGILSYDEVTGFVISYHKKFGKL